MQDYGGLLGKNVPDHSSWLQKMCQIMVDVWCVGLYITSSYFNILLKDAIITNMYDMFTASFL